MSDYEITDIGSPDEWRAFHGGFDEARSRGGRGGGGQERTKKNKAM
jgi:hypothetical protein